MSRQDESGLLCLQVLFSQVRRAVNFSALMTSEVLSSYSQKPADVLLSLTQNQKLRPEKITSLESIGSYAGPALIHLNGTRWILLIHSQQLLSEKALILDPTNARNTTEMPTAEIRKLFSGEAIILHNLAPVDAASQTRLTTLVSLLRHHNVPADIREIMHEYAVGEAEVSESLFRRIVKEKGFQLKKIKLSARDLEKSQTVFPCIAIKKDGTYAVMCGIRPAPLAEGETPSDQPRPLQRAVVDPTAANFNTPDHFIFLSEEEFSQIYTGEFLLLKKHYALSDSNQPFSLRWFIPEFIRQKSIFGQIALMVVLLTIFSLVIPLFFQITVDKILVNQAYNTLNVLGIGILTVVLFHALVSYVRSYLLLFATNKIDIALAMRTFAHLMRLPLDFFERISSGVLLKHMQQTEKIRGFLSGNLFFTILDLFALCLFVPFLLFYSAKLTLIVLGFSTLMALVIASLIRPFQRRLDELYQAEGKRQSMLVETIHGVKTVKALALEPVERKIWDDSTAYAIKAYFRVGKISMSAQSISQMLEMMMTICIIWVGALMVFDNQITIGALIAFQMLAGHVTGPLVKIVGLIHEYQQIALSVRMLGVVMNTPEEPAGGGVRNPLLGGISFDNVSFRYRPDLPFAVKDFSLNMTPGMTVGFVGRSGSGKTTITKLLQGLYPTTMGLIKLDGIDLREIDKSHLRRNIGVVLQDNYFFSGTVRENIALPKQNASLEEIIYASRLAGADEFVQKMPRGYDTMLEENASNLSGGQKQRLAIARALLTNPPILIFDEATSSLDPESEQVILQNLNAIARGRTVIIVSHRLSIVSRANQIIVIDNGKMADHGTHEELLSRPGIYKDFWNQQMNRA